VPAARLVGGDRLTELVKQYKPILPTAASRRRRLHSAWKTT